MAELYVGQVTHMRWSPKRHGFAYELAMIMVDVDKLDGLFRGWWPVASCNFPAIISFRESQHLKRWRKPGQSLGEAVRQVVRDRTGWAPAPGGKVLLLTHPAYFGYCFNPVSFYYVYDATNTRVECVVAEVSNTPWNEMHLYVLHPGAEGVTVVDTAQRGGGGDATGGAATALTAQGAVEPTAFEALGAVFAGPSPPQAQAQEHALEATPAAHGGAAEREQGGARRRRSDEAQQAAGSSSSETSAGISAAPAAPSPVPRKLRYQWAKDFHVSPFMSTFDQRYDWIFTEPGDTLLVQSQNLRGETKMFNAQVRLTRRPALTFWSMVWLAFVGFPFLTWRLQWWIHYEAFRLWWKGVELYAHPTGATNTFTRVVGALMWPFLALSDALSRSSKQEAKVAAAAGGGADREANAGK